MERSGVRLRLEDSAKWNATDAQDRGRGILLQLLTQITEFLERKEMMSSRVAASNEWRKSRSRRHAESSNNLFEVVLQVCGQRMRRLKRSERDQDELSAQSPRVLVAEAIVQELLVSLMELRMKEKETMVMDEVENVEVMRKLHVHLKRDEEQVRNRVCVGAGDEQQLEELQLMLRTDFLEEVASADSPQKRQQTESAANNEASLQFAWETIDDQKKEIVRLRAENEELKRSTGRSSSLKASLLDDDPAKVIEHLRSQLSSHHDKNLDILQDHIQRLERALQTATATARKKSRGWDGSRSTMDSSRSTEQDDWSSLLSRSAVGTDFSRTQVPRRKCEECRKSAASLLALRSEVKQLRAHAATDEESLVQAEKDRGQLQRENAALSTGLLTAKQKQEELRQMIVDLTQEKHQLQNLSDSEERTSERTICLLKDQLGALEKQKAHQKRKLDELIATYDAECSEKQALMKTYAELEETNMDLSKSATELQAQMTSLKEFAERQKEVINAQDVVVTDLRAQLNSKEQDGKTQATALQKKQAVISNLKAELSELQLRLDKLESEKRKASGENERLLQTLDECKRKNQRLELGIEELKQGKELIVSLQQVERENSALQHSELQQAREQINSMNIQLSSTKTECIKLEQALAEMKEANDTLRQDRDSAEAQHTKEVKQLRDELKAMQQDRTVLEEQVKAQEELQEKLDTMKRTSVGQKEQVDNLSQELAEAKTTMLMWMNKYNTACSDRQRLESEVQGLSEEQYSLQRRLEEAQADRDAIAFAGEAKSQAEEENEMELRKEVTSLKEQHRSMAREHRITSQENKSLAMLVQTLQARPELQQRAFREMLMSLQRGTERTFDQLSQSVTALVLKLGTLEQRYQTLKASVAYRNRTKNMSRASSSGLPESCRKLTPPQIVVQTERLLSSSGAPFDVSMSQSSWFIPFDTIPPTKDEFVDASLDNDYHAHATAELEECLKHWKWKYFIQSLASNSSKKSIVILTKQLRLVTRKNEHLKKTIGRLTWQKLKAKMDSQHFLKLRCASAVLIRRLSEELQLSQQARRFAIWKHQIRLTSYQDKLKASANEPAPPEFSLTTTTALGNCIQLLQKFCEPTRNHENGSRSLKAKGVKISQADELTGYLVEINTKVSSWKVAVDRKITEFAERNTQLRALQTRCSELKDLVGLNQRLIEEMERRAAGQQSIVEAAWDFATAYKALSPSARAQVFQSREFLSASKGIVENVNSLGMSRSVHKLSQTLGASRQASMRRHDDKVLPIKPNFLSTSAAPGVSSAYNSRSDEDKDKSRKRLNDSNIELLEDAVGSLKGAMQKHRTLQRALKDKEQTLAVTKKELGRRNLQFLLLRSFLQWKCTIRQPRDRARHKKPSTVHGIA